MTLIEAIKSYQQADADGVMVLVSRQACDEAAAELSRYEAGIRQIKEMLDANRNGDASFIAEALLAR